METPKFRFAVASVFFLAVLAVNLFLSAGWKVEDVSRLSPLVCPLRAVTGMSCPTCGLGRSLIAAAGGRWDLSWSYHPMGIPVLGTVLVSALIFLVAPRCLPFGRHFFMR